jgi:hypothetical protein
MSHQTRSFLTWFHATHYRTFKAYYIEHVQVHLHAEFPRLVSYSRLVELTPTVLLPLLAYLRTPGVPRLSSPKMKGHHSLLLPVWLSSQARMASWWAV